ncbi:MAG: hypothetical protein IKQ10_01800 [Oscillospiraceae bacterium]|nr:hypothetical protein [Oscillospiraceae bacterium]
MLLLLAVLGGSIYGALYFRNRTAALEADNQSRVDDAQSELDAQKAAYAAIDPSTDEGAALQLASENEAIEQAQQQTQALEAENEKLRAENEELAAQVSELEADEDNAYYLKAYESMRKGMELVEAYFNGE